MYENFPYRIQCSEVFGTGTGRLDDANDNWIQSVGATAGYIPRTRSLQLLLARPALTSHIKRGKSSYHICPGSHSLVKLFHIGIDCCTRPVGQGAQKSERNHVPSLYSACNTFADTCCGQTGIVIAGCWSPCALLRCSQLAHSCSQVKRMINTCTWYVPG